jgi:hypothetical protein
VVAVGLLGDSAGFLAIAIRAAVTDDPELRRLLVRIASDVQLRVRNLAQFRDARYRRRPRAHLELGILRYPLTIGKLLLIVSVILVGALVIDGALEQLKDGGDAQGELIAAATWDVIALTTATFLAVYKPGRRRRRALIRE